MAKATHSKALHLWANGEYVGAWAIHPKGDMALHYDASWAKSPNCRPISLSLPIPDNDKPIVGPRVANYFEGLLPDSNTIRKRIALRFKTGSLDAFNLLAAIGRDCVGALHILPEGETPARQNAIDGVEVDDEAIEQHLLQVTKPSPFGSGGDPDDDFRISLAGAQEKDAFLRWNGKWMKPRGSTPTTHIFKMPLGLIGGRQADFSTSVDNEWLCLRLLAAYGLPVANASIQQFGKQRVLVVERFDRAITENGKGIVRLMQEDFCQATGTSPLTKYENEGGPGLQSLFDITRASTNATADLRTLMAAQILFYMLRAPDGHAKNFSIRLLAGRSGRFSLTPLYDIISAYPVIGNGSNQWAERSVKLAMALHGKRRHYAIHAIERRHFESTAKLVGYPGNVNALIDELIERTPGAIAEVMADLPTGISGKVVEQVMDGLRRAFERFERM